MKLPAAVRRFNRNQLIFAVTLGVVLLGAGIIFALVGGKDEPSPASKQFRNWLKPAEVIKVGQFRYKSPCQVLPVESVKRIFGEFGTETSTSEEYLDSSVASGTIPLQTYCHYLYDYPKGRVVELNVEQYFDTERPKQLYRVMPLGGAKLGEVVGQYKAQTKSSNNDAVKAFVDRLEKSYAVYRQSGVTFDRTKFKNLQVNGLVFPTAPIRYDTYRFITIFDNTTYEVGYKPPQGVKVSTEDAVVRMEKAYQTIAKNARDAKLDQSPAPTILGDTDTYGSTPLLEPCAVLNKAAFKAITGVEANDIVQRANYPKDVYKKRIASIDKVPILPKSSCDRTYKKEVGDNTDKVTVRLELNVAKSTAEATEFINKYFKANKPGDARLQTSADWAATFANTFDPSSPTYAFRAGPYLGFVTISTLQSTGLDGNLTQGKAAQQQHITAINTLVPNIKQQQAEAGR